MSNQVHQIPPPSPEWLRESSAGETSPRDLEKACEQWKPKGAVPAGAVSHFAHRLMDRVTRQAFSADELVRPYPLTAAPVNAAPYSVDADVDSQPGDGDALIVTLGNTVETWTFKTSATEADEIEIGVDAAGTAANIIAAMEGISSIVTVAEGGGTSQVTFTAILAGTVGVFSLTGTATEDHLLVSSSPTDAVDATSGVLGAEWYDASYLYKVVAVTVGVPTWRKIAHSAL